ncbi:MAG TPA: methyltransferase domain-containing protein [Chthoniobacteraceae bacterium]|nr:methyltransferase domain-containing protein [Chthoniobacteraceae bacterium]
MITAGRELNPADVAGHYDDLDQFYRDVWGDHVHHGLWVRGGESHREATLQMVRHVAALGRIGPGARVCDIGCGYGATARMLAADFGAEVTGVTVSPAQYHYGAAQDAPRVTMVLGDWLRNPLPDAAFDVAIAIESSEHMPDIAAFFREAARVLRPGGRLVVCSWLAHPRASGTQRKLLLEPICREGRMSQFGTFADYRRLFQDSGFVVEKEEDVSLRVKRTWPVCAAGFLRHLLREPRYARFLLNGHRRNRVFALTIFRLWIAFETGAMRYGILTGGKL